MILFSKLPIFVVPFLLIVQAVSYQNGVFVILSRRILLFLHFANSDHLAERLQIVLFEHPSNISNKSFVRSY